MAGGAAAADPGLWRLSAVDRLPAGYDDGLAADAAGHLLWSGAAGRPLPRQRRARPQLRLRGAIPGAAAPRTASRVSATRHGTRTAPGRLLVPLQCAAGASSAGCPAAAIGVYDAGLIWRYYVQLDRSAITSHRLGARRRPTARSCGPRAGATCLSSSPATWTPTAPEALRPVERFAGALPLAHVTGSAIWRGRPDARRRGRRPPPGLVARRRRRAPRRSAARARPRATRGDPRGLEVFDGRGGLLHCGLRAGAQRADVQGPGRLAAELRPRATRRRSR